MKAEMKSLPARERILATASDLFYRQGYRATGINEVIEKAGVAKATFYSHFPTKDDLCLAYLQQRNGSEAAEILEAVQAADTPLARFLAVMESIEPWAIRTEFRGCQFINMVPEVPDNESPLRAEGHRHYNWATEKIRELTEELIASDPKKYEHLDVEGTTKAYVTHLAGSIALAGVYNELWPIQDGIRAVRQLVE